MKITITHRDHAALAMLPLHNVFPSLTGYKEGELYDGCAAPPVARFEHVTSQDGGLGTVSIILLPPNGGDGKLLTTFRVEEAKPGELPPRQGMGLRTFADKLFYVDFNVLFSNGAVHKEKIYPGQGKLSALVDEVRSGWYTVKTEADVVTRRVEALQMTLKFFDE